MATVSTFASTSSALLLLGTLLAAPAAAGPRFADLNGHLGLGYAKLANSDSPGGSLTVGAGVEYPFNPSWSLGVDVGFALLGSKIYERGSLTADVDYSLFETVLLAHWVPSRGPVARVSVGPGVFHARAGLSTQGPTEFRDLPVEETKPGMGLALGFGSKRPALVKAGFELAARAVWLEQKTWTVALARLTVHY